MKYYIEDGAKCPHSDSGTWWFLIDDGIGLYVAYNIYPSIRAGLSKNKGKRYLSDPDIKYNLDYSIEVSEEEWYNEMYLTAL